jgi:hypothetical protein
MAGDRRPGDVSRSTVVDIIEQPGVRKDEPLGCSTVTWRVLPHGALIGPVLNALRAHSNPIRGFGRALSGDPNKVSRGISVWTSSCAAVPTLMRKIHCASRGSFSLRLTAVSKHCLTHSHLPSHFSVHSLHQCCETQLWAKVRGGLVQRFE